MMTISPRGLDLIRQHESCRLEAYQDSVGIWTIGWGHTLGVKQGDTCTQEQADAWLKSDVHAAENCIDNTVDAALTQPEFDALCSFTFNLGCAALRNSTLLRKLNSGDYDGAAAEFKKWDHAGGKQLAGLTARRAAEAELFEAAA
jgi:lysozyme